MNKVKIVEKRRGCIIINNVVVTGYHCLNTYVYKRKPIVHLVLFHDFNNITLTSQRDSTLIDSFFFVHGYSNEI